MNERNFPYAAHVAVSKSMAMCKECARRWHSLNANALAIQHTKAYGHSVDIVTEYVVIRAAK